MVYRRPLLSELNDVDASSQADRFALVWDAEAGFHRYTELNVAAVVGLQDLLEEYSSSIGARVVANNPISGGTATKITFDEKGLVTGGTAATTADVDDSLNRRYVTDVQLELLLKTAGTNTGDQDLSGYSQIGHGHSISEITGLQTALDLKADLIGGVIPSSQLPALVIPDVRTVASESEMLSLIAQTGDIAIRTDISKTFIHNGGESGTVADWSEIISPTDAVTSVNGLIGNITLGYGDVGAAAAIHYHEIAGVSGLQTALDGKAASSHTHTISDLTDLPTIAKSSTGNALVQANATGTINDSFLPTYLARLNAANIWTANQVIAKSSPEFRMEQSSGATSYFQLIHDQAIRTQIRHTSTGNECLIDIDPILSNGTGGSYVRLFRDTTAGFCRFLIYRGNGSGSIQSQLSSNGDSYFNAVLGNFAIGHSSPKAKFHSIGSTIFGAATAAVADADLGNGQINPYVDEVAHTLKIKVKYSNGTIRTATIALVA